MARGGKGDEGKKLKLSIPSFTDLADAQVMNERQEIPSSEKQEGYEVVQKNNNKTVPVTDDIPEQFLNQFLLWLEPKNPYVPIYVSSLKHIYKT